MDPANPPPPPPASDEKCAEESHAAEIVPLDLLLLFDKSGSMGQDAGGKSKWDMAREALSAFLQDNKSAGLGVGLQFFPIAPVRICQTDMDCGRMADRPNFWCHHESVCMGPGIPLEGARSCDPGLPLCRGGTTCTPVGRCALSGAPCVVGGDPCPRNLPGDTCGAQPMTCQDGPAFGIDVACMPSDYQAPRVAIAELPAAAALLDVVLGISLPNGGTPMGPAVEGALAHLSGHVAANPGRRAALVLISDGLPDGCGESQVEPVVARLQAAQAATPSISTYVIGVFNAMDLPMSEPSLVSLAQGGGTGMPFVLTANANLSQSFLDALNQIRGKALACEFAIPAANTNMGQIDYGKVNVHIAGAGGGDVLYVGSADRCDPARGGWYYDVDPAMGKPSRILTCEATCARLKAAGDTKIELRFGCRSRTVD